MKRLSPVVLLPHREPAMKSQPFGTAHDAPKAARLSRTVLLLAALIGLTVSVALWRFEPTGHAAASVSREQGMPITLNVTLNPANLFGI